MPRFNCSSSCFKLLISFWYFLINDFSSRICCIAYACQRPVRLKPIRTFRLLNSPPSAQTEWIMGTNKSLSQAESRYDYENTRSEISILNSNTKIVTNLMWISKSWKTIRWRSIFKSSSTLHWRTCLAYKTAKHAIHTLLGAACISTRLALWANFRVLWVSSLLLDAGVMVQINWKIESRRDC